MDIFKTLALMELIDTPEMRTAIMGMESIPEIHRYQICNCINALQWRISQGENIVNLMNLGYQQIVLTLQPTEEALTAAQRLEVLNTMVTVTLGRIDNMKTQVNEAITLALNPPQEEVPADPPPPAEDPTLATPEA